MNPINIVCLLAFVVCASTKNIAPNNLGIINGEDAELGQFPHQVSLRSYSFGDHFCGGSILTTRWILTAAHCTQGGNSNPDEIYAVVGTINRRYGGKKYLISEIHAHEDFDPNRLLNDICLLLTKKQITFNENVKPIALPTANLPEEGNVPVTISGWGASKYPMTDESSIPITLQYMRAKTLSYEECKKRFAGIPSVADMINRTMVCTTNPGSGICFGDSGGPLITEDNVLAGLADWVIPCAKGYPDGYTRVYSHLNFIENVMNLNAEH